MDDLKTLGHFLYTTLSFVHHFKAIHVLKLELQSGNPPIRVKIGDFLPRVTWNLTDDLEKQ